MCLEKCTIINLSRYTAGKKVVFVLFITLKRLKPRLRSKTSGQCGTKLNIHIIPSHVIHHLCMQLASWSECECSSDRSLPLSLPLAKVQLSFSVICKLSALPLRGHPRPGRLVEDLQPQQEASGVCRFKSVKMLYPCVIDITHWVKFSTNLSG